MSNVYFPFFPNDHLGDINLRGCHPAAKGIWWDMVCYMAQGTPFGHLRLAPGQKPAPPGRPPGGASGIPPGGAPGTPAARARARERATPPGGLQIEYNLPPSGSLERELPRLLGQPEDLVRWAIAHLENRQVFSRDRDGIIFCRRMVRWAKEREDRKQRALEAYQRRQNGARNTGQPRAPGGMRGTAPGGAPAPPPGTPPGGPHGQADATAPGVPGGRPLTLSLSSKDPTPQPPPRKRGVGVNPEHVEQLVRERTRRA